MRGFSVALDSISKEGLQPMAQNRPAAKRHFLFLPFFKNAEKKLWD
ncbi:hypothetical protein SGRA_3983 [Saprospira grandis str. Lewin]|uniref:Uncharacterized protein n=1 Tax=Saprospira grandis (strain Lewin) TaxID=984262 RepID=H6L8H3_SAPGL|nr:hypothetical protein SGRA_3983 [Saprospira grandis str. Lewin]